MVVKDIYAEIINASIKRAVNQAETEISEEDVKLRMSGPLASCVSSEQMRRHMALCVVMTRILESVALN